MKRCSLHIWFSSLHTLGSMTPISFTVKYSKMWFQIGNGNISVGVFNSERLVSSGDNAAVFSREDRFVVPIFFALPSGVSSSLRCLFLDAIPCSDKYPRRKSSSYTLWTNSKAPRQQIRDFALWRETMEMGVDICEDQNDWKWLGKWLEQRRQAWCGSSLCTWSTTVSSLQIQVYS